MAEELQETDATSDDEGAAIGRALTLPVTPRARKRQTLTAPSSFSAWMCHHSQTAHQKQEDEMQERSRQNTKEVCDDQSSPVLAKQGRRVQKNIVRDITEVRRIFKACDEDCSGSMHQSDFLPLLQRLMRLPKSEMDMKEVLHQWEDLDSDGLGHINIEEVQRWYCNAFGIEDSPDFTTFFSQDLVPSWQREVRDIARKLQIDACEVEKIWNEFKKLDKDGSGALEQNEFDQLIRSHFEAEEKKSKKKRGKNARVGNEKAEVPQKMLQKFWNEVDADSDGAVSFEEFVAWYHKSFYGVANSPMEQYYQTLGKSYRSGGR